MYERNRPLILREESVLTRRNREWQSRHHLERWAEDGGDGKREGKREEGRVGGREGGRAKEEERKREGGRGREKEKGRKEF